MSNLHSSNLHKKITDKLLDSAFIKTHDLDPEIIESFIKSNNFIITLENILNENNFNCQSIFNLVSSLIDKLTEKRPSVSWIEYTYQYALSKSFPHAVDISLEDDLDKAAVLYLQVLKIFNDYDRKNKNSLLKYSLKFLTSDEESDLKNSSEYRRFKKAFHNNYVYEMMMLNQELTGHNTLDHIRGVHHVAIHIGRQLYNSGLPVDLGRVSGAAAGHDIGKYGCTGKELRRVPYLHYYYTDLWFRKHNITYIGHIATNHSTWDLELENLPLESLILIYSDFRVKNRNLENNQREMHIYSLKDSFEIVLNKLDNLDEAKERKWK